MCQVKNKELDVTIDQLCAGLWAVKDAEAPEYLWQGDGAIGGGQALYGCMVPWSFLPSRKDVPEVISTRLGLLSLEPGKTYETEIGIKLK